LNRRWFSIGASAMLVVPAIAYLTVVAQNQRLSWAYLSEWFLPNYAYMAAPHLIAVGLGLAIKARRVAILGTLAVLNVSVIAFQLYVWFSVLPRESGLAWVLYIPLSIFVLITVPLVFTWFGRRRGPPSEKQLA